jgi:hypothetical protein
LVEIKSAVKQDTPTYWSSKTPNRVFGGMPTRAYRFGLELATSRWVILAVFGALTLTILEGAIRKWIVGTDSSVLSYVIYFSKDIAFIALLFLPAEKNPGSASLVFRRWLIPGSFLLISGAMASSVQGVNLVGSALTLRAAVLLPLIAYFAIKKLNGVSLRNVALLLTVFTFANFVLGIYQNSLPADSLFNRYASSSTDITVLDSGVRATGTFAYIAGMGVISMVGIWAGMVLLSLSGKRWDRLGGWVALISGFGCSLTAVSRSPVILGAVMLLIWGVFYRVGISSGVRILVAGVLMWFLVMLFGLAPTFSNLGEGLIQRGEEAGDTFQDRAFGQFEEAYEAITIAPFGNGLGSEQVAGNFYKSGVMSFTTFENQLPRLIMETGVFGLVGFLMICVGAVSTLQFVKRSATTESERSVLLATQLLLVSMFYTNVLFNHTASAFTWVIFVVVLGGRVKAASPELAEIGAPQVRRAFLSRGGLGHAPRLG